jgi:hypothetical protein
MALHHDPQWPRASAWFSASPEGEVDLAIIGVGAHESAITPNSAHKTPKAIRKALQRYSTWNQTCQIDFSDHLVGADFGDVADPEMLAESESEKHAAKPTKKIRTLQRGAAKAAARRGEHLDEEHYMLWEAMSGLLGEAAPTDKEQFVAMQRTLCSR